MGWIDLSGVGDVLCQRKGEEWSGQSSVSRVEWTQTEVLRGLGAFCHMGWCSPTLHVPPGSLHPLSQSPCPHGTHRGPYRGIGLMGAGQGSRGRAVQGPGLAPTAGRCKCPWPACAERLLPYAD